MKICPSCRTQYSDDTLKFCLQDGTRLFSASEGETPTAVLGELETVEARRGASVPRYQNEWGQGQNPFVTTPVGQKARSNTALAVVLTALGMLLLFGVAGIAAWLYSRSTQSGAAVNTDHRPAATTNSAVNPTPLPKPSPAVTSTRASSPLTSNTTLPADDSQSRLEIQGRLGSWKSQSESLDLDAYMTHYAANVDYYSKTRASIADVRRDKQRAFTRYDSINLSVTNVAITTGGDGQTATAIFDKEWDFRGDGSSSGKVQQMLRFAKVDGEWLITAEKDLKLYYKR